MKISIEIDTNEPVGDIPALVSEVLEAASTETMDRATGHDVLSNVTRSIINAAEDADRPVRKITIGGEYDYIRPSLASMECHLTYTVVIAI